MTRYLDKRLGQAAVVATCLAVTGLAHGKTNNRVAITQPVAGPVTLRLRTVNTNVRVSAHKARSISVTAVGTNAKTIRVIKKGNAYRLKFDGIKTLTNGTLVVGVPSGSKLDVGTVSGNIDVRGVGGDLRGRTVSGDVTVKTAKKAELATVSGDVELSAVSGDTRIKTVSGDLKVTSTSRAPKVKVTTTSGDLSWKGQCATGCGLEVKTLSGDIRLALTASSFKLGFSSFSGDLKDGLGVNGQRAGKHRIQGAYGNGAGSIRVRTFSGRLKLTK